MHQELEQNNTHYKLILQNITLIVIKNFYEYLNKQIGNIKPLDIKITEGIILGKTTLGIEVKLSNGKYGKYLICGDKNINLKYLIPKDSSVTESNIESNSKEIIELVEKNY